LNILRNPIRQKYDNDNNINNRQKMKEKRQWIPGGFQRNLVERQSTVKAVRARPEKYRVQLQLQTPLEETDPVPPVLYIT
jgi:hypothetical protein